MGLLQALARSQANRAWRAADEAMDMAPPEALGRPISVREQIHTPAGVMELIALGETGPAGAVDVRFGRVVDDNALASERLAYGSVGDASTGKARAAIEAVEQALMKHLGGSPPANLVYTPSAPSRYRLYEGMLGRLGRRGGPAYRRTRRSVEQQWTRPLTPAEEAALQRYRELEKLQRQRWRAAESWDRFGHHIGPVDNVLTYGAPVAGGAYALNEMGLLAALSNSEPRTP